MANTARKKGIGIIGYGGFGEFIRAAWDRLDNARVVAVSDSDPARAPVDVRFYQEIGPLLHDPEVDIVSVATPPNSHRDIALMAIAAGKNVLVEKPLALSADDGLLIKTAAERAQVAVTVNFMLRYNPIVEALRSITQSGVLGKIRRADLRNYAMRDQVPEGHWFWDPQVSGRIFLEHGVHFFDIAGWVLDSKAADVCSLGVELKPGMEDKVFAAVRYENDAVGTFWHSFSRPKALERTTFHFAFDLGEIDMLGWIPLELRMWGWTDERGLETLSGLGNLVELKAGPMEPTKAHSSDCIYDVSSEVSAVIELNDSKMDVYSENLRSIMSDLIDAIEDPSHRMRVTLDDAIEAVRTAEMATKFVHPGEKLASPRLEPDVLRP